MCLSHFSLNVLKHVNKYRLNTLPEIFNLQCEKKSAGMFHFKGELTVMLHILSGQSLCHLSRKWLKVKLKEKKNKRQMKLKYFAVHNVKTVK